MARRDLNRVRLITRNGHDFSKRFPQIVAAIAVLPARSCLIDGEVIVTDEAGLAVFELLRSWRHDHAAVFCAFDLLEHDGEDLRRLPIERRKARLARMLRGPLPGMVINEHFVGDGDIAYQEACQLGCEGIVSNRLGSAYRSGRSKHWLKVKNPAAPAVQREAEEEWRSGRRR
jgi:ATP-dependent DNA ligase